jgi:hypothetical protein
MAMTMTVRDGCVVSMKLGKRKHNGKEIDLDELVEDSKSPLSSWKREAIQKQLKTGVQSTSFLKSGQLSICGQELDEFDLEHFPDDHPTTILKKLYGDLSSSTQRAHLVVSKPADHVLTPIPLARAILNVCVEDLKCNDDVLWCTHHPSKLDVHFGDVTQIPLFGCAQCKKQFISFKDNYCEFKGSYVPLRFRDSATGVLVFERMVWMTFCSQSCLGVFSSNLHTQGLIKIN